MAMESSVLNVEGMSCQHCVMSVEKGSRRFRRG